MSLKNIETIPNLSRKKVLLRADLDIPINNGQIEDTTRIGKCLPTIKFLLENGAKVAILTKIGRPEEGEKISTKILIPTLEKLLNQKVSWVPDLTYPKNAENLVLFENVRFYKEEGEPNEEFAKKIASQFDIYVNEAFAMCHRNEASVSLVPKFLPSYAGFTLMKEYEILTTVLTNPKRPLIVLMGGAKVETKLPVVENMAKIADKTLIGGKISLELNLSLPNIINAKDWVDNKDIGQETISSFKEEISKAGTIIWNGPMGMFENPPYDMGTNEIAKAVATSSAFKIIGGGDTISAIAKADLLDKIDFVSTGGGAMLTLLSGKLMPGISALESTQ